MATMYKVTFDRIGRRHDVPAQEFQVSEAGDSAALAEDIYYHAKKFMISRDFDVTADIETGKGSIDGGRFGTFTIEEVPAS